MTNRNEVVGALLCMVVAVGSGSVFAQPLKKGVEVSDTPGIHGFSVALVLGDMQGQAASSPDNLPPGAKKALADMRDFLPYKSYQLLDTQWILCCGSSKVGAGVSGRLRGMKQPPGIYEVYSFSVTVLGVSGTQLSVRFVMNDGAEPSTKNLSSKMSDEEAVPSAIWKQEQALVESELSESRKKYNPEHQAIKNLESRLEFIKGQAENAPFARASSGKGAVIASTFSMDIGETVVIGTSSLKGEKALIALLTAVRRPRQTSTQGERQ